MTSRKESRPGVSPSRIPTLLAAAVLALTGACGGGGGGADVVSSGGGGSGGGGSSAWTPGVFLPATSFQALCADPRPGNAWPDRQGSVTDENNFLRSYSNDTYLWYDEIPDRNPADFDDPLVYFDLLRTGELTDSGNPKDQFHFTYDTDEWLALSQSGVSAGYGAQFAVLAPAPPRRIVVAYTDPGSPATDNNLARGAEILAINGVDAVNNDTQQGVDLLNAALFPGSTGETYEFTVRDGGGGERSFSMTSTEVVSTPVQNVSTLTTPTGDVGYLLFNDHIATSEELLVDAVNQLDAAGISDLVIDIRYNGGGFLDIAAQLAFMIAGQARVGGLTFELQQFNDKHPATNPVTGEAIQPLPFHSSTLGFSLPAGAPLPSLDLPRVFVLTGTGTCSASEALMNGLRGAGVDVVQIGSTTCGKPYGFYPTDNCGTTYFTIQFRGVNAQNFGDYADGFSPSPAGDLSGAVVPGCAVGDDFGAALGDAAEARLAAALQYRETGSCPAAATAAEGTPRLSQLRLGADDPVILLRDPRRENRILERP